MTKRAYNKKKPEVEEFWKKVLCEDTVGHTVDTVPSSGFQQRQLAFRGILLKDSKVVKAGLTKMVKERGAQEWSVSKYYSQWCLPYSKWKAIIKNIRESVDEMQKLTKERGYLEHGDRWLLEQRAELKRKYPERCITNSGALCHTCGVFAVSSKSYVSRNEQLLRESELLDGGVFNVCYYYDRHMDNGRASRKLLNQKQTTTQHVESNGQLSTENKVDTPPTSKVIIEKEAGTSKNKESNEGINRTHNLTNWEMLRFTKPKCVCDQGIIIMEDYWINDNIRLAFRGSNGYFPLKDWSKIADDMESMVEHLEQKRKMRSAEEIDAAMKKAKPWGAPVENLFRKWEAESEADLAEEMEEAEMFRTAEEQEVRKRRKIEEEEETDKRWKLVQEQEAEACRMMEQQGIDKRRTPEEYETTKQATFTNI